MANKIKVIRGSGAVSINRHVIDGAELTGITTSPSGVLEAYIKIVNPEIEIKDEKATKESNPDDAGITHLEAEGEVLAESK